MGDPESEKTPFELNMEAISIAHKKITKVSPTQWLEAEDDLAVEEPLEIQLQYGSGHDRTRKVVSVTMRTPGNDEELALGFLFTEGIIRQPAQVAQTQVQPASNSVLVTLQEDVAPVLQKIDRNFYTTSSCGVCGKTSIDAIKTVSSYQDQHDELSLQADLFYRLAEELAQQQTLFQITGGLHASAFFDLGGHFLMLREDVGRHNALDKLIGAAFLKGDLPLHDKILFLSGRASFELIQKASMAGIKVVAAVGAPSSLAVQLAEDAGITLIGFLRDQGFNIYSGGHRIALGS
jgi:FdhD protein